MEVISMQKRARRGMVAEEQLRLSTRLLAVAHHHSILNAQRSTLNAQRSTLNASILSFPFSPLFIFFIFLFVAYHFFQYLSLDKSCYGC